VRRILLWHPVIRSSGREARGRTVALGTCRLQPCAERARVAVSDEGVRERERTAVRRPLPPFPDFTERARARHGRPSFRTIHIRSSTSRSRPRLPQREASPPLLATPPRLLRRSPIRRAGQTRSTNRPYVKGTGPGPPPLAPPPLAQIPRVSLRHVTFGRISLVPKTRARRDLPNASRRARSPRRIPPAVARRPQGVAASSNSSA
jgi:hypothetical protein